MHDQKKTVFPQVAPKTISSSGFHFTFEFCVANWSKTT